jgi:amino acid transporter
MQVTANSSPKLVRGIRRWDIVAVALNGIIGAGIFGIPSESFKSAGVYSIAAFAACAIVIALIVLCFAEVSSRFETTGGPYLYAREAFGPIAGFEVGWLLWLARLTAFAANLNLLVEYLGFFWPAATTGLIRASIITFIVLSLTAVNLIGVRDAARASNIFTIGKLIPLAVFIGLGLFFLEPANFQSTAPPSIGSFSSAVLLLIYAFSGFEIAVIPAGEVQDPRRNLPMAMLTALVVITIIYILIQIVCVGTLPELGASTRPLADAATAFLGRAGASFIAIGALISISGNLNVLVLAASRLPFALAEQGELPRAFAAIHPRFHTPHVGITLTAMLMLVATLSGTFVYAATISVVARLLAYAVTCASLIAFRRRPDIASPHFTFPGAPAAAVASLLLIAWLLGNITGRQARDSSIAVGLGLLIWFVFRTKTKQRSPAAAAQTEEQTRMPERGAG